jgi:lysozyme family protein
MDLFPSADRIVVGIEGAHGNQAQDPGGDSWFGIARNFHPDEPWPPTWGRAQQLRHDEYWTAHHCDVMPWPWALVIYDAAINEPDHGLKAVQDELGIQPVDGVIGPQSLVAILRADPSHIIRVMGRRIVAYSGQPLWTQDGLGWSVRALEIYHAAMVPPPV